MKRELRRAVITARDWFNERATVKCRDCYFKRGKLGDDGNGAVYVYFKDDQALYVGESGRPIKSRMHDQTSPHKKKKWWKQWDEVAFINIKNPTERVTLELLLILSLHPKHNKKPEAQSITDMFNIR